jgi:hypothetical protein
VEWCFEYTQANYTGTYGDTVTICNSTHIPFDENITAYKHYMTDLGAIPGMNISGMVIGHFYRNATGSTDTYEQDAYFNEFDIHYEIDSMGSRTETSK